MTAISLPATTPGPVAVASTDPVLMDEDHDAGIRAFRGVMFGILFSIPLWGLIIMAGIGISKLFS